MIKISPKCARLKLILALILVSGLARAQTQIKAAPLKTTAISAQSYRAKLQKALTDLKTPRPNVKTVRDLDARFAVRRADGQIQSVANNFWSNFGRTLGTAKTITPDQAKLARQALQNQIGALDEWTRTPIYQSADARKIVADLAASGQIRVGPLWWQKAISDAWGAVVKAWKRFMDWLASLFPKAPAFKNTAAPSDKWLWILFYLLVSAILGLLLWFAFRAFGGNWARRNAKSAREMEGEDAELLQLPPAELLSRAERFAAQGNFREALRHRYLSLLLDLDARGVWRYDARRTNWEHIAALNRSEIGRDLVAPLSDLTKRFDRVRYGGAACDDQGWRRFDGDARAFENSAVPIQNAAAEMEPAR